LLHFATAMKPPENAVESLGSNDPLEFGSEGGGSITVNQPFVKAVLLELARVWPATLPFDELLCRALTSAPPPENADAETMLRELLLRMQLPGAIDLNICAWPYAAKMTKCPTASRLARHQARNGSRITSLRHRPVELDEPLLKMILPLLDGTRDAEALRAVLAVEADDVDRALVRLHELALLCG